MACSCRSEAVEGPAILQLQKWDISQLDLSEFREAFISPTRNLLILLSLHREALLLPLVTGGKRSIDDPGGSYSFVQSPTSTSAVPSKPGSSDNIPTTSSSVEDNPPPESPSTNYSRYPIISDVKSLAWGHCGDAYNQHGDAAFRELLFVSGNHGITVHAFCYVDKSNQSTKPLPESVAEQGRWVEWDYETVRSIQNNKQSTLYNKGTIDLRANQTTEIDGSSYDVSRGKDDKVSSLEFGSKKWLKTFLTKAETIKLDGSFFTKFPVKPSYPCSAEVVSFSIFDNTSVLLDFLSRSHMSNVKINWDAPLVPPISARNTSPQLGPNLLNPIVHPDNMPGVLYRETNDSLQCSSIFSSSSHHLIGFVFTLADPIIDNKNDEKVGNRFQVFVLVTMICEGGVQWASSIKLKHICLYPALALEWTDFKFSDNLLLCLHASGLIIVYSATTGEPMKHLDVLQICGVNLKLDLQNQRKLFVENGIVLRSVDVQTQQDRINHKSTQETKGCTRRIFKKLMVSFCSLFLAVIDDYGVVYMISFDHYISNIGSTKKILPHLQHYGIGMLIGWEVGGLEIGSQKELCVPSDCHRCYDSSSTDGNYPEKQKFLSQRKGGKYDSCLSGFSASSQIKFEALHRPCFRLNSLRKVFLPVDGCGNGDFLFFSPLGITRLIKNRDVNKKVGFKIVHQQLHVPSEFHDDRRPNSASARFTSLDKDASFIGNVIGCAFQGNLYLVTEEGLSVVLPSVSVSSNVLPSESSGYWRPSFSTGSGCEIDNFFTTKELWPLWKLEVLDRVILYDGAEAADHICSENGWDLKFARLRRLQLALDYMKMDEIEQSLEMLVQANIAEEGILRILLAAVYQIFCKVGNDNEIALASRLLALAASFAIRMIRRFGLLKHETDDFMFQMIGDFMTTSILPHISNNDLNEMHYSRRLNEMAHFLEVIRNMQFRLDLKCKRPSQESVDDRELSSMAGTQLLQDDTDTQSLSVDIFSPDEKQDNSAHVSTSGGNGKVLLMPIGSVNSLKHLDSRSSGDMSIIPSPGVNQGGTMIPLENPKDMITRWEIDKLDLKTVVKDALSSGRLPLAVLQIHLQRVRDLVSVKEDHDIFNDIREVGRTISYELFLKGETGLAIATLQRLGEDIEISLKELLFGTVRRSFRTQIAAEMQRCGYLTPYEWKTLEQISLIERLYPSSSFWGTFCGQQKKPSNATSSSTLPVEDKLQLICSHSLMDFICECGEINGVVLGPWANIDENSAVGDPEGDDVHFGYWAAAAVWSDSWDQRTIDRIVLDQHSLMGVNVSWESQMEYYMCHNDWGEVSKLLEVIPSSSLSNGSLKVYLDDLRSPALVQCDRRYPSHESYACSADELDSVCMNIPNIKILKLSSSNTCSIWLRRLMEQELAKKCIFLKDYFECTAEIIPLLSCAGFIINKSKGFIHIESSNSLPDSGSADHFGELDKETKEATHKTFIHHCAQHDLPNLLDLYLDHHELVLDNDSLSSLLEAVGDCEWAKWLLLSRVKGHEYDASFSNARSITSHNLVSGSKNRASETNEIIRTVDDMAEGGWEMAALATLVHAPSPIQDCLCSGSVNRRLSSSAQCTLENLRPALQRFPTLWRTLVAACFGQDANESSVGPNAKNVFGHSALSNYLNWREKFFSSAGRDTSLVQMLPCWFSKAIRRLIQLFVQGPFGWQSLGELSASNYFLLNDLSNTHENAETSAISWEAAIQKRVEEELYASALEGAGFGLEHHLHRGRALAVFNHLLGARVQKLKSGNTYETQSSASVHGKMNVQADVQVLLAPITRSEESLLSSVVPLAIMNFDDSVLVASCAFLLELCGLSASMLHVDIAALRRISSFYVTNENNEHIKNLSPRSFHAVPHKGDIAVSLARALADDRLHEDSVTSVQNKTSTNAAANKQPSRALLAILQHLEKASLPLIGDGKTSGSWLFDGSGDGTERRFLQKTASQHWSLVTSFCQMHQIPLSTKYLSVLANDNDWVGFLTEAQVGGYPSDVVMQVAMKKFSDPRLKVHMLTVLKSMVSTRRNSSSSDSSSAGKSIEVDFSTGNNFVTSVELFGLLAECENKNNPGEALLAKAKDLRWSLLAIIASCFPDVTSLACLTVWLEITAARETSSIKVNDIASQIANHVGAAVDATNALPDSDRGVVLHYNRRNSKRRRLIEFTAGKGLVNTLPVLSVTSSLPEISVSQDITSEEERKKQVDEEVKVLCDPDGGLQSLSKMVRVLCEQRLFLPLLRAFEMFLPSCSLLPFLRALQAFTQMRLSEASVHLASFSFRIKEEPFQLKSQLGREGRMGSSWIGSTAVGAADAMLSTCPSAYEERCLLQLLAATDFGDGGSAASRFRRLYWKVNLAEPSLRKDDDLYLGNETLDDASLLLALEKHGHWDQARNWARQLEATGGAWKAASHHVTETQAEAMVAEWKEFLWDIPEERAALWSHCQNLFLRYSFPPLQAGLFFLNHAEVVEKDISARELHEMLLLSLQWLSGTITQSNPVYPLHLLREIETRVWLLAVESEAQIKIEGEFTIANSFQNLNNRSTSNIVEQTAIKISKMDNHLNVRKANTVERSGMRENNLTSHNLHSLDTSSPQTAVSTAKIKRRAKSYVHSRKIPVEAIDKSNEPDDSPTSPINFNVESFRIPLPQDDNGKIEASASRWEERVGPEELERAVLSLLEFGQVTAAKQLQHKLSPDHVPSEFLLVDVALKLAAISTPACSEVPVSFLDADVLEVMHSYNITSDSQYADPLQVLESLTIECTKNGGQGLCRRIIAVVKAANVLGVSFAEAFGKQPLELLQLLSLKAQDSFDEAKFVVQTHSMPPASIAQILAESFLKGLLAAHRGGYMDSQKEEGPAPLLWRISDFMKWAELCPSEPEIGHALMRLVITGQEIPHACEVELLILAHHFYKSSSCLDGVDVLVSLAATRVECYVSEGDFACLARLVTGVSNFHALNFILGILIENGQLELLLQKYSAAESATGKSEAVRGFRMAVLTSLKNFNPHDLDACAMVYHHFDMKHETAALLESQAMQFIDQWFLRYDQEQTEDLLEAMHYFIKAAEVHTTVDTGNKTRYACAQAFLLSLQIRMPDFDWLNLSMTNARRALVEQSRFQEALIVAEAYNLNQPSEWALVLWNQMLKPELTEEFVAEFVAVLPLHPSMLADVAKFYRAEVAARGDQTNFSVWLSPGGLPAEWLKHLARSFRCLLKRTRDIRLRLQLATVATGFGDVVESCHKALDKVPDTAGPLVLRKGHGGAYLPLM